MKGGAAKPKKRGGESAASPAQGASRSKEAASLDSGPTLIEASAGTGKTFTISRLFLRLLVERDVSVREILVVTYTEAATEELRDRIRQTLRDAADYLRTGHCRQPDLAEVLAGQRVNAPIHLRQLERALTGFDEAPIFTIHGFCQRTLRDRAFESGDLFDLELLTDETELLEEVAADYWRTTFYQADPVVVSCVLKEQLSPGILLHWWRDVRRQHDMRILSRVSGRTLAELMRELVQQFSQARDIWAQEESTVRQLLAETQHWAKGPHAKPEKVLEKTAATQDAFRPERFTPETIEGLEFLAKSTLAKNTRVRKTPPDHSFFAACQKWMEARDDFLTGLRIDFIEQAGVELGLRKRRRKQQSFDDLLLRLREALRGAGRQDLLREVRLRYRAALIDEFQDTDPVQYEIFRELFAPETGPAESAEHRPLLFLIGDPKQAIYAFRGADIFTYRDAARRIQTTYTLEENWRSETPLVHAVNTLFGRVPNPFVFDFIRFQPVTAAGQADEQPLYENGQRLAPFHLWFVPRPPDKSSINAGAAESDLARVVAGEIVRLLSGSTTLGATRAVTPRDIAVLVPKNRQARVMQEALREVGLPSVLHTEETVFGSREAAELSRVLAALASPTQERLLRAAWVTDLLGFSARDLEETAADAGAWQKLAERAVDYRNRWLRHGFSSMFRFWLQTEAVRPRLLRFIDGERRLTNLLHLGEILHQAAHQRPLGPAGLVRWLEEQIAANEPAEAHQLRLERDDQAVRLVTIHKSKGLQYPIVFCPFSWGPAELKRWNEDQVFCHREVGEPGNVRSEFIWDLGSEELSTHRAQAGKEKLAENLRLLYVALTRAQHRCYFAWGAMTGAGSSAAAWLLHQPVFLDEPLKDCLEQHFRALDDNTLRRQLADVAEASKGPGGQFTIQVWEVPFEAKPNGVSGTGEGEGRPLRQAQGRPVPMNIAGSVNPGASQPQPQPETAFAGRYTPPTEPMVTLAPREFTQNIPRDWRISSFSTLARARIDEERPDYDRMVVSEQLGTEEDVDVDSDRAPVEEVSPSGIFAFPRGSGPGTCLHKIFEALDFTDLERAGSGRESLDQIIQRELEARGLGTDWTGEVSAAVRRTLLVPLTTPSGTSLTLSRVRPKQRLTELEFQFPTASITPQLFQKTLGAIPAAPTFGAWLARLGFQPVRGFLKGYIDLVFEFEGRYYLLDWKSNWLGNRVEDYGPGRLEAVMSENYYVLQYHLYTVALHLYLARRMPDYDYDQHFGGVWYLFLRGLDPARPQFGVFQDRPTRDTVSALAKSLVGVT